ncbi:MBL fold metallo-hydrolase [Patescibacteria group bacterium]|nr:MBL fold metallo-hydrolase [Patescibacteria group bacterium]
MKNYWKYCVFICVPLVIGICFIIQLPHTNFLISFLDVGQGDAIFIRTPDDYTILIDGGPGPMILDEIAKVMPIYTRTIDILTLTHPHADHVNGLVEIVKRYNVKRILLVGTPSQNEFYQEWLKVADMNNIEMIFASNGTDFRVGSEVFLDILWPIGNKAGVAYENLNNASLAMRVIWSDGENNVKFLLTGDAEIDEESEILNGNSTIKADVLKAGHHGSRTASSEDFLEKSDPRIVVIQSGEANSFGHPHQETLKNFLARNIQVRRNDLEGRIDFIFSRYQPPTF